MKHRMWELGVNPLVVPNGLSSDAFVPPARDAVSAFQGRLCDRTVVSKVARWDPDKRWLLAIDTVGAMKREGWQPLLIARGGVEAYGSEVLERAAATGLRVVERTADVVAVVERDLLTPYGLRSLAPYDPQYRGRYAGGPASRDSLYHQGTVWAWLMEPFLTAYLKYMGRPPRDASKRCSGCPASGPISVTLVHLYTFSSVSGTRRRALPGGGTKSASTLHSLLRCWRGDL